MARAARQPVILVAALLLATAVWAEDPNACDQTGEAPDLTVGSLDSVGPLGGIDGISAYTIGATSCNLGSCWLDWFASTNRHPIFGQNLFRLLDGRFEQIGQSWVHHRFFALSLTDCETGCIPTDGTHLGTHCATANSEISTANQGRLGPKFEVDASTGAFPYPHTDAGVLGNHIYKRLQVLDADLDPASNTGALYFAEGQYVSPDDAAAGHQHNNASYRQVLVSGGGPPFALSFAGPTKEHQPAILAWAEHDPEVTVRTVDVPGDGRLFVASRATDLGEGVWHYEYAIQNLTSDRSVSAVTVPIPAGAVVTDPGFHDVDYHSGEPFDGTDWAMQADTTGDPHSFTWTTQVFEANPNANALRWGTLYNYRFDVDAPPVEGALTLSMFKPGGPAVIPTPAVVPRLCDVDDLCETGEDGCNCPADCGDPPAVEFECMNGRDDDCDGRPDCTDDDCCAIEPACAAEDGDGDTHPACADCADHDPTLWTTPSEARELVMRRIGHTGVSLDWHEPLLPGAVSVTYEALRSSDPGNWSGACCLELPDPAISEASDETLVVPGGLRAYLVRARNGCPQESAPWEEQAPEACGRGLPALSRPRSPLRFGYWDSYCPVRIADSAYDFA